MPSTKKRIALLGAAFLAVTAVVTSAFLIARPTNVNAAGVTQQTSLQTISLTGTSRISGGATSLVGDGLHDATPTDADRDQHTSAVYADAPTTAPDPTSNNPVTSSNPGASGFQGLNHVDTRSQDGGNAFSLEPPDQGLCVGNGFVVESSQRCDGGLQSVWRTRHADFLDEQLLRPAGRDQSHHWRAGRFLSDPKCLL